MFTIFHVFQLLGLVSGLGLGVSWGANSHGMIGGVLGGVAGLFIGGIIGRLPFVVGLMWMKRRFGSLSPAELRRELRDDACPAPNLLLLELKCRGENIEGELPHVLSLLGSEHSDRRVRGWAALNSAFPDAAKQLSGYNPLAGNDECQEHVDQYSQEQQPDASARKDD